MNFTWNVVQMERLTSDGFVVTVHYTVNAVDGEFTASTYGTVGYTQEDKPYTPYADLTQAVVVGWVQDSLGKDTVEQALATHIEAQKNPVQQTGLPWVIA
jgi:cystathionine beta-lyase family protein involved in aluminum resistance